MASTFHVVYGAAVALAFWTLFGFVVLRRRVPSELAWPLAPAAGWAIHSVLALPIFFVVPFSATTIALVSVAVVALWPIGRRVGRTATTRELPDTRRPGARVPAWTVVVAGLLAMLCAAAILPKHLDGAVVLSDPIFDHAKVALIDDIARLGLPPGNPFLANDGGSGRLAYYYLWHFSAAEVSRLLGVTGWEADAAMTFVAAFASLTTMMGLAVRFSGRANAALWVVLFAASSSTRFLLVSLFTEPGLDGWIQNPGGFAGWFFQSAWVPQHLASTSCVLIAVYLLTRLAARIDAATIVVAGLMIAAGFESSTWVGGVTFALAAVVVVPVLVLQAEPARRLRLTAALAVVGAVALFVAWSFVHDQIAASALRTSGAPIALSPFPVLGENVPEWLRRPLDPVAFWSILLPIEMTAIYLPGLAAMRWLSRGRAAARRREIASLAAMTLTALAIAGLLRSTLADNNDLSWRAGLLAATGLIVFAAAGLATWIADRRWTIVALVAVAAALGLPEAARLSIGNLRGHADSDAPRFAAAPELWTAVRRHAGPAERVANNPQSLEHMTPWPVNIGWSLLANRRSCYATWELTQVYTSMPHEQLRAIDRRFIRVFGGDGTPADVAALANDYDCSVVVLTPEDGAWTHDPFRDSADYALVDEKPDAWRIYRRRIPNAGGTAGGRTP